MAWKRSGLILKGKDKAEVNKKRKYTGKLQKKKASYKKQQEASDKVNKETIYIAPKSTMFLPRRIRPRCPHVVIFCCNPDLWLRERLVLPSPHSCFCVWFLLTSSLVQVVMQCKCCHLTSKLVKNWQKTLTVEHFNYLHVPSSLI